MTKTDTKKCKCYSFKCEPMSDPDNWSALSQMVKIGDDFKVTCELCGRDVSKSLEHIKQASLEVLSRFAASGDLGIKTELDRGSTRRTRLGELLEEYRCNPSNSNRHEQSIVDFIEEYLDSQLTAFAEEVKSYAKTMATPMSEMVDVTTLTEEINEVLKRYTGGGND